MPYKLTWEKFGVYRQYFGDVSIVDRRASFDAIFGDRRFDDLRYVITDYLAVETYEVTSEATVLIAALHIGAVATNPRFRIAAVTDRPEIVRGIEAFKGHHFINTPYCVFPALAAARRWINDEQC